MIVNVAEESSFNEFESVLPKQKVPVTGEISSVVISLEDPQEDRNNGSKSKKAYFFINTI